MKTSELRKELLSRIGLYWELHPEMTLGQIINRANTLGGVELSSIYYARDETLLTGLREMTKLNLLTQHQENGTT